MTRRAAVHRIATAGPDDVQGLLAGIAAGTIDPAAIVAILGKTEGNGCVNDFTRGFAVQSLRAALTPHRSDAASLDGIAMVMSGGTEGGLSPHLLVLEVRAAPATRESSDAKSLAIGVAHIAPLQPPQIGRLAQSRAVEAAVREAMASADLEHPDDVHYVQVKCPLLTAARGADAARQGQSVATTDTLKSMGLSRGAAALGVAMALGEIDRGALDEDSIGTAPLYARRASCSAGVELMHNEIVVMGNSRHWTGDLVIGHAVMADAIDTDAVHRALASAGINRKSPIVAVLAKAEPDPRGHIRGARHIMLDDSDIAATRHARALVGGVLAGVVGHTALFVSGGAEHQGPPGGGPVAIIARQ